MIVIKTLLALIPLLIELVDWIKETTKEDPAKFVTDLHEAMRDVKDKKDPKKLQDIIKRL